MAKKRKFKVDDVLVYIGSDEDFPFPYLKVVGTSSSNQFYYFYPVINNEISKSNESFLPSHFVNQWFKKITIGEISEGFTFPRRVLCKNPTQKKLAKILGDVPISPKFKIGTLVYSAKFTTLGLVAEIKVDKKGHRFSYLISNKLGSFSTDEKDLSPPKNKISKADKNRLLLAI